MTSGAPDQAAKCPARGENWCSGGPDVSRRRPGPPPIDGAHGPRPTAGWPTWGLRQGFVGWLGRGVARSTEPLPRPRPDGESAPTLGRGRTQAGFETDPRSTPSLLPATAEAGAVRASGGSVPTTSHGRRGAATPTLHSGGQHSSAAANPHPPPPSRPTHQSGRSRTEPPGPSSTRTRTFSPPAPAPPSSPRLGHTRQRRMTTCPCTVMRIALDGLRVAEGELAGLAATDAQRASSGIV